MDEKRDCGRRGVCVLVGRNAGFISASRSEAKMLGERRLLFCLPLFRLLRPIVNAVITFRASEAKNYTWE